MDKNTFFSALTDKAATPDPVFVSNLQKKIQGIAGGGASGGLRIPSNPNIIAAIVASTALIGAAIFGIVGSSNSEGNPPSAPIATTETEDDSKVLSAEDDNPKVVDEQSPEETPIETVVTDPDSTSDTQPSSSSGNNSSDSSDQSEDETEEITLNENYTVEFWTVPLFKISPVIQDETPDYVITDVENLVFDWGERSPGSGVTKNHFVARATATKALSPGNYIVNINADDGVRVFVDGILIFDRWKIQPGGIADKATFNVAEGSEQSTIVVEYFEFQESAHLDFVITKD